MPGDSKSRDFDIERYPDRDQVVIRLVSHYGLSRRHSDRAVHHSQVGYRWIHVEGTRRDFSVRFADAVWKIRIRRDPIGPRA